MRDYVHLHRQALSSWVFEDARRWHLFCYLLMKADQQGRAEVSVKEYAETFGIPRTTCRRIIDEMKERGMVETKTATKRPYLTICKYEYYNTLTAEKWPQNGHLREEKEGERESNVSPTPLSYKEKEEEREEIPTTTATTMFAQEEAAEEEIDKEMQQLAEGRAHLEALAMREHLTVQEVLQRITQFRLECIAQGISRHQNKRDLQSHFAHWLRKRLQAEKQNYTYAKNRRLTPDELREIDRRRRMEEYASVAAYFRNQGNNQ